MAMILPEEGNIFGRLGKGLGEGLAKQGSKEIERYRNVQGLSSLAQQTGNPILSQIAQLQSVPGIYENPSLMNAILPYLQQQGIQQEAAGAISGRPLSGPVGNPPSSENVPTNGVPTAKRLLRTPEARLAGATEYARRFPLRYGQNYENAEKRYLEDVDVQEKQIQGIENVLDKELKQLLQTVSSKEQSEKVAGEIVQGFKEKAIEDVLSGKGSEDEIGKKYSKEMSDFVKARDKQISKGRNYWENLFKGKIVNKELEAAKKTYDKIEKPELYLSDLIAYNKYSLPRASERAFPLEPKAKVFFSALERSHREEKEDPSVYQKALDTRTDKDSLQNFALQLKKKGYSPQGFLKYALENGRGLNPRQDRELQEIGSFEPSLADILNSTLIGKGG